MAEPFGVVAGAVSISAAFTACVDCFGLRLTRWGQAVDVYNDTRLGKPEATATEIQTAKDTLLQILALFADSEDISKKFKQNTKAGEDITSFSATDMDPTLLALQNKMQQLAIWRQKGTYILKLTSWALYPRSELKELIESITLLVDNIEKLFPAPQAQIALVRQEATEIGDKASLRLVQEAAKAVDGVLRKTVQEVLAGHQYLNVGVRGQAQTGDAYSSDWKREAIGASHTYDGVEVEKDGKALIGNKYGGKDFWDP